MKYKKIILSCLVIFALLAASTVLMVNRAKTRMKELFQMNKALQEENYYMAEFEFKMLGIGYYLSKGNYSQSLSMINALHTQLKTKEGLIKMPQFATKQEELDFYLNLQNPKTGAIMDDRL